LLPPALHPSSSFRLVWRTRSSLSLSYFAPYRECPVSPSLSTAEENPPPPPCRPLFSARLLTRRASLGRYLFRKFLVPDHRPSYYRPFFLPSYL
jgi:hypothetical protein